MRRGGAGMRAAAMNAEPPIPAEAVGLTLRYVRRAVWPCAVPKRKLGVRSVSLDEIRFERGSAGVSARHLTDVEAAAKAIQALNGGLVGIGVDAHEAYLAFDRANTVMTLLHELLDGAPREALTVCAYQREGGMDSPLIVGIEGRGMQFGPALFEPGSASVREDLVRLVDRVAGVIGRIAGGEGAIGVFPDLGSILQEDGFIGIRRAESLYRDLYTRVDHRTRTRMRRGPPHDSSEQIRPRRWVYGL